MAEFCQDYLTQPTLIPENFLLHGINTLTCALKDAPAMFCNAHLTATCNLQQILHHWAEEEVDSP